MRPTELDYTSRGAHYFDVQSGEIIVGKRPYKMYLREEEKSFEEVPNLGELLREPTPEVQGNEYQRLDVSEWPARKFVQYGHWLQRVVAPPADIERLLNRRVFDVAAHLGAGPIRNHMREHFPKLGDLYVSMGFTDGQIKTHFDDWEVDDFVRYLKHVGGDRRPTQDQLNELGKRYPSKPRPELMNNRFKEIGGVNALLELAGYPVVRLWEPDDFLEWGAKFMEANNGQIPTARMVDFMSSQHKGPSSPVVSKHFDKISLFQEEASKRFWERQEERERIRKEQMEDLMHALTRNNFPVQLLDPIESKEEAIAIVESEDSLSAGELLVRYSKYKVLRAVYPSNISNDATANIVVGNSYGHSFTTNARRHFPVDPGEVEHAALILGCFDLIWPMEQHLQELRLGEEYEEYYMARQAYKRQYDAARKSALSQKN